MSDNSTYLAFDLGAESGRAIAARLSDGRLSLEEVHRFANLPITLQGTMYWDIYGLLRELRTGLKMFNDSRGRPAGVGIDTWGVDFGLLAADGSLLAPPVCYRDHRNDGMVEHVQSLLGTERIYDRTGVQFMQINSICQLAGIQKRTPEVLRAAGSLLFVGDLLAWYFCGRRVNEYTIASTSQLIDPRTRDWADDLLKDLGIPREIFPEIVQPGSILGPLSAEFGQNDVPLVAVAHHDTGSAVAAVPAEGDDWACISCGTWSIMGAELKSPKIEPKGLAYNFTNEGGVAGTTRFMKNIAGLWPLQRCRAVWAEKDPALDYTQITRMASEAKPFAAIIDVDFPGFLNPPDMPAAIADYCRQTGQRAPESVGGMARTILEGLAMSYRRVLDWLEELMGRRYDKVHIVGGGTQNELLMQFAANAMNRTVVAGPIEATAIGNAMMQAIATGQVTSLAEARKIIRDSFPLKIFEPQDVAQWQKAFQQHGQLSAPQ